MKSRTLFDEFPEVSGKAWKQKIQYDLKGADYNEALVWESPEGIKVKPFYHAEDISESTGNSSNAPHSWFIGQSIYAGNAVMANEKAKKALQRGVERLWFIVPSEKTDAKTLLKDVDLRTIAVYFELQFLSHDFVKSVTDFASENIHNIYFNIDIIGNLARSGNWYIDLKKDHDLLHTILKTNVPNIVSIDASLYENAGADNTQQLGYALAQANEYLNHLCQNRTITDLKSITFKVSINSNYFFEIAKLRALRLLWNTLASEYDLEMDCHIIATPSKRNKTIYDYNVNMLRTTTECMSAILGGANTVFNMPYDAIYHKDNEFGERIALNQLILLKEESYFDKVNNISDGSYYIETLTDQLAEKGLELFKSIEKGGGFLKQLKNHTIQNKIKETAQKQQERFNAQKEILVGTNKYLNATDRMKQDLELHPFVKTKPRKTLIEPILEKRLAEEIEQKRLDDE